MTPGVDSASNRNEYQVYFLGGKCDRFVRLTTLPPSCTVVMKSVNLNFLESSGPLQACNGTALPFSWIYPTHNKDGAPKQRINPLCSINFSVLFRLLFVL